MPLRRSTYSYGLVLAQGPAEPAQVGAAQADSTTVDKASAPAAPGTRPRRQDNASAEPMGQAKRAFDYTPGGRKTPSCSPRSWPTDRPGSCPTCTSC